MKFRDALKKDMAPIVPNEQAIQTAVKQSQWSSKKPKHKTWVRITAVACTFVFAIVGIVSLSLWRNQENYNNSFAQMQINRQPANAKSYDELLQRLQSLQLTQSSYKKQQSFWDMLGLGGSKLFDGMGPNGQDMPLGTSIPETVDKGNDYSDTNNQVQGVQEADIVKTDGKFIYALVQNDLRILQVDSGSTPLTQVSCTEVKESVYDKTSQNTYTWHVKEMHLYGDRLVILYNIRTERRGNDNDSIRYATYLGVNRTGMVLYDVSDRSAPQRMLCYSQSGAMLSSRMVGQYLYLISNDSVYQQYKEEDVFSFVPSVISDEKEYALQPQDIYMNDDAIRASYVVLGGIDINDGTAVSQKAVLGSGNTVYVSEDSIYLTCAAASKNTAISASSTSIVRVQYKDGVLNLAAQGSVPGWLLNQFSMDEYNGYFRIVTTDAREQMGNALFVLDKDLKVTGKITGIAPDEQVKSVRFDGEIGYFVTFRQTDPLFAVNLSNPENPVILSKLKIPGYSSYMQTYGENLLLGIGYEADEISGGIIGVKVSMFDTTDKTNVTQKHKLVLSEYYYTAVQSNHKGVLADSKKGIVCFPADNGYVVLGYDAENGFYRKAEIFPDNQNGDRWSAAHGRIRALYIGDNLYVCYQGGVYVYSINSAEMLQWLQY